MLSLEELLDSALLDSELLDSAALDSELLLLDSAALDSELLLLDSAALDSELLASELLESDSSDPEQPAITPPIKANENAHVQIERTSFLVFMELPLYFVENLRYTDNMTNTENQITSHGVLV